MGKTIFWDFDGTLAYSDHLWTGSVHRALIEDIKDTEITFEQIRPLMRSGFPWHTYDSDHSELVGESWWAFMTQRFFEIYKELGVEEAAANRISGTIRQRILDINNYSLYEDAEKTLIGAKKAGYSNYILSNNYPELLEIVKKLGIEKYFEGYIISGKIGYDKPRKEIFEYALKAAGQPEICYMIGDNPIADIKGAKAMGMKTILVHRDAKSEAGHAFLCLEDILGVLE